MVARRSWFRILGIGWIWLGVVLLMVEFLYFVTRITVDSVLRSTEWHEFIGPVETLLGNIKGGLSWLTICIMLFAIFCIILGGGLSALRGWSRTIASGAHIVLVVCILAMVVWIYSWLTGLPAPGPSPDRLQRLQVFSALAGLAAAAANVYFAYQLSQVPAMDAFLGFDTVAEDRRAVTVTCPTCKTQLTAGSTKCSHCDGGGEELPPMSARLVDRQTKHDYPVSLNRDTFIGRANPEYAIRLEQETVSFEHAYIEYYEGRFILHALSDTNGTFVNNRKIRDVEITHEDLIQFGQAEFQFIVER